MYGSMDGWIIWIYGCVYGRSYACMYLRVLVYACMSRVFPFPDRGKFKIPQRLQRPFCTFGVPHLFLSNFQMGELSEGRGGSFKNFEGEFYPLEKKKNKNSGVCLGMLWLPNSQQIKITLMPVTSIESAREIFEICSSCS